MRQDDLATESDVEMENSAVVVKDVSGSDTGTNTKQVPLKLHDCIKLCNEVPYRNSVLELVGYMH